MRFLQMILICKKYNDNKNKLFLYKMLNCSLCIHIAAVGTIVRSVGLYTYMANNTREIFHTFLGILMRTSNVTLSPTDFSDFCYSLVMSVDAQANFI